MDEKVIKPVVQEEGGRESGYLLSFEEDGVYLTVYPRTEATPQVNLTDLTEKLHAHGFMKYGLELLSNVLKEESGRSVKIVDESELQDREAVVLLPPKFVIEVSKDRMKANLKIEMEENSMKPTFEMAMEELQKKNICYGIDESGVRNAINRVGNQAIIARGNPPVHGKDAVLIKKVDLTQRGRPKELENGRVDFKSLRLFITVRAGELLVERIPQTQGTPGMDIYGNQVAAKPGKPAMLPNGKNTKILNEHQLVAAIDGQVVLQGTKYAVDPSIEIRGDVDLSTGNIEFNGSVFVRGSVQAGFSIHAAGDVEVAGTISGGTVEGRNVIVKAGIQGMSRGGIKAQEDVRSTFIENAKIIAGRDAIITDSIMHSTVSAGKRIVVEGGRGVIAGGSLSAGEEILAKTIGTQMDTSTRLEVGVNPMLLDEYQKTKKALEKAEKTLDDALKAINLLKAMPQESLSQQKREMLLRLTKSQFPLANEVNQHKEKLAVIETAFEDMKLGKIRVSNVMYPGVKLIIGSVMKSIQSKVEHATFYEEEGDIKMGPF